MATVLAAPKPRIELIDALRGSALLGILLVHSIEHFDFLQYPPFPPPWLRPIDGWVFNAAFFLFGGKAYAIFAMMFGLSFFIILDRAAARGVDFRARFAWRLVVLWMIGYLHSLFYCGDILTVLAVTALPLVFLCRLDRRILFLTSILLLLQVPFLVQLLRLWLELGYTPPPTHYGRYYGELYPAFGHGGFLAVCQVNLLTGHLAKWWWTIDNGRYLQMVGLSIWGLLLGRSRVFEDPGAYARLARRALAAGLIGFAVLYPLKVGLGEWLPRGSLRRVSDDLVSSYVDLAQMLVWVGGFVLLYHHTPVRRLLHLLAPYGRMSLTCYVTQALFWVPIYYNFGLGLFRLLGPFFSVSCGAAFFVLQLVLAHLWFRRFAYGPLEWLWRCATLWTTDVPFRKVKPEPVPNPVTA